jgi:hypothetical protein
MTGMKTAAIALLLHVVLFGTPSFADPILYGPGDPIPDGTFASTGVFLNFLDGSGSPVTGQSVSGINSQQVAFETSLGVPVTSRLRFDGVLNDAPVDVGVPFLLGYVTYTNGIFLVDTFSSDISMQTVGASNLPARYTQTYSDRMFVNITPNSGIDPEQDADIVSFRDRPDLGSLRIYEGREASIQLMGMFGSLDLFSFGAVVSAQGSGFFFPTIGTVPSDFVPMQTGDGTFIAPPISQVPEPSTLTLFASALALGLGKAIRRRASR